MVTRLDQRERVSDAGRERAGEALAALAEAGAAVAAAVNLPEALAQVADGAVRAARAEVAIVRVVDEDRASLSAAAVSSSSPAIAAELSGTKFAIAELSRGEVDEIGQVPEAVARAAQRVKANAVLQLPLLAGGEIAGSLELLRAGERFDESERQIARLSADQAVFALRVFERGSPGALEDGSALALAGEALVAGADAVQTGEHVVRLAVRASGAAAALLWRAVDGESLGLVASSGVGDSESLAFDTAAERAFKGRLPVAVETTSGDAVSVAIQLGQPPLGILQLLFPADAAPSEDELARLATFGVRAALALHAGARAQTMEAELDRTRALLAVVQQAISQLSLAHTLETAVARVAELLGVERLAVYLREEDRLYAAAGVGLAGPHARVAERLLELALGPFRGRGLIAVRDVSTELRLGSAADAAAEAGIEGAVAVPLLVRDDPIGLLGVFPERGRILTESESALLGALAAQLAVAVQNAQLHEDSKRLVAQREGALESERAAARQLRALYEISRSFAQSLSLEATLEAVARTVTEVLDVDLALIRMPDERRELLLPRALHIVDERMEQSLRTVFWRPEPFGAQPIQRLFRLVESFQLTPGTARRIGAPATALLPFLERGWSGAVVPIATPAEVLASLTLISMQPGKRVTKGVIARAEAIAGQAALAIDNARLYQQQKRFADTMQRSLLPRELPKLPGLDIGDAYQSSARVEVGGDVYDFVELADGRLAVVLGDVTGHGIEAAADMAMAKFVFRSLAREHPEPADFLQAVNDVVVGEIAPGKFITMVYLVVDLKKGEVAAAGAGHPPPRLVGDDGLVHALDVRGLVLGIEPAQKYPEVRASLGPGGSVVLYTDGVLEARREGELYGFERLDAIVSAGRHLSALDLAETVLADCREFANNELSDDCAVVVVKRVA